MNPVPTSLTGSLSSTVHVLQADAETVAAFAAVDWNRHFRRACLDPVRGLIPRVREEEVGRIFGVKWDWTPSFLLRDDPFKSVTASIVS